MGYIASNGRMIMNDELEGYGRKWPWWRLGKARKTSVGIGDFRTEIRNLKSSEYEAVLVTTRLRGSVGEYFKIGRGRFLLIRYHPVFFSLDLW